MITINIDNGQLIEIEPGTTLFELSNMVNSDCLIVAASVDSQLKDLNYELNHSANVKFFDLQTYAGSSIYEKSLSLVFIRAVREVMPASNVMIEHSLSKGLYCEVKDKKLTAGSVKKIEARIREIIKSDEVIEKINFSKKEAADLFQKEGRSDLVNLIKYIDSEKISMSKCGWLYDYYDEPLVPSTGYLEKFSLQFHLPGVILRYPTPEMSCDIPEYIPQPKLAKIFYEAEKWAEILEVNTVSELNDFISNNKISLLIKIVEALHEKKIAEIADQINSHKNRGNIILISGPSSSGKTTFAERLKIQLMVNGLKPISISLDNYFVDREKTPLDINGNYNFEALEAIDLELFNDHLVRLIQGEKIKLPVFNFKTGKRFYCDYETKIKFDQPIIIEGIHGLNEKLTYSIPKDHKFKIYISCLTQLNKDNHNRIPTRVTRKIRRIVRDFKTRGHSAVDTLKMWPSVCCGEDNYIYPYQENADIMFNSSLIYELAVLKPYAEPILKTIGTESEEYIEAQRLLEFFSYFLPVDAEEVPLNSILREFIQ